MSENGNGHGVADKALRALALDWFRKDLVRLREFVEDKAQDHPEWAMAENLLESLGKNASIAFELSGDDLRPGLPLAKREDPEAVPEAWLERVTRRIPGVEENRALIHATRGYRLACNPATVCWGNTFGKHMLGCPTCRAAHDADRIKEGGEIPEAAKAGSAKPEAERPARVLRGGKGRGKGRKATTRTGKRKVAV